MRYIFPIFLSVAVTAITAISPVLAISYDMNAKSTNFMQGANSDMKLVVNNRPLVKIHGKMISVLDVQKQMDQFLRENHPEAYASDLLRYQYYAQRWQSTLQEMIDTELIVMEAEELKVNLSDADVNQELHERYGPNVARKLDQLGMTLEEAKEEMKTSLIARNMTWFRVWSPTHQLVTPDLLKQEYQAFLATQGGKDEWAYQTLTIRGSDESATESVSQSVHTYLLDNPEATFTDVVSQMSEELPKNVTLNVSSLLEQQGNNLSPEYISILERLPLQSFSPPIHQTSRSDGSSVYRIFQLKKRETYSPPVFEEKADDLWNALFMKIGHEQREAYLARLRKRFYCEDLVVEKMFPASYQPFVLVQ